MGAKKVFLPSQEKKSIDEAIICFASLSPYMNVNNILSMAYEKILFMASTFQRSSQVSFGFATPGR